MFPLEVFLDDVDLAPLQGANLRSAQRSKELNGNQRKEL
jgi:hypothetical protein